MAYVVAVEISLTYGNGSDVFKELVNMTDDLKMLKQCIAEEYSEINSLPDEAFEFFFGGGSFDAVDVHEPLSGMYYTMPFGSKKVKIGGYNSRRDKNFDLVIELAKRAMVSWKGNSFEISQIRLDVDRKNAEAVRLAELKKKRKYYSAKNIVENSLKLINDPIRLTKYLLGAKEFYDANPGL